MKTVFPIIENVAFQVYNPLCIPKNEDYGWFILDTNPKKFFQFNREIEVLPIDVVEVSVRTRNNYEFAISIEYDEHDKIKSMFVNSLFRNYGHRIFNIEEI